MRLSQLRVTWVRPSSAVRSRRGAGSGLGLLGSGRRPLGRARWLTMRGGQDGARAPVLQFTNCRILRGQALLRWGAGAARGRPGRRPLGGRRGRAGVGAGAAGCFRAGRGPGSCRVAHGAGRAALPPPPPAFGRREDLWVREGRVLDPEKLFFEERRVADERRDCGGCILAPGFIDVQINGAV